MAQNSSSTYLVTGDDGSIDSHLIDLLMADAISSDKSA
jgi:hypothetical protein